MDYLKYLLVSLGMIIIIGGQMYMGISLATLIVVGGTVGYIIRYRPSSYAISYIIWIILIGFWGWFLNRTFDEYVALNPQKYAPNSVNGAKGVLILSGLLIFHPVSYGIGRLLIRIRNANNV